MNGNTSTGHLLDYTDTRGSEHFNQNRQLQTLLMEAERTLQCDPDIASTCLNQAIDLLAVESQAGLLPNRSRGGLARWQISRVERYVNEHLDRYIKTTELASLLDLSVSHFSQAFKQATGMTPLIYVTSARLEAARQYMLFSAKSSSEIALSLGFCDQSHFCRVFRRETGLSPQAWRKLHTASHHSQKAFDATSSHPAVPSRGRLGSI